MKKLFISIMWLFIVFPMVSMAGSTRCATKYPVILVHGMGQEATIRGITDLWGNIAGALKENGARVYITNVSAMESHAVKAAQWKEQVLQILAVSGAAKVNVIGVSDGCLYSRYAISNLGLAPVVASHTSMSGPHRGSSIADMIMGITNATGLAGLGGAALDLVLSFVYGDPENITANGNEMTRPYMQNVFNPHTPNMPDIYYQSYAATVTNALGTGLLGIPWMAMLPLEGANDGLVSNTSAKWGNFRGLIDGGTWSWLGGVNHLAIIGALNVLPTPGYDPPTHFVNVTAELKTMGY